MKSILRNVSVLAIAITMLTGCEATKNANNQQKGSVIGAAGGAIIGAVAGQGLVVVLALQLHRNHLPTCLKMISSASYNVQ